MSFREHLSRALSTEVTHSPRRSLSVLENVGRVAVRSVFVVIWIAALLLAGCVASSPLTALTGLPYDLICRPNSRANIYIVPSITSFFVPSGFTFRVIAGVSGKIMLPSAPLRVLSLLYSSFTVECFTLSRSPMLVVHTVLCFGNGTSFTVIMEAGDIPICIRPGLLISFSFLVTPLLHQPCCIIVALWPHCVRRHVSSHFRYVHSRSIRHVFQLLVHIGVVNGSSLPCQWLTLMVAWSMIKTTGFIDGGYKLHENLLASAASSHL